MLDSRPEPGLADRRTYERGVRQDFPGEVHRNPEGPSGAPPYDGHAPGRGHRLICELTRLSRSVKDLFDLVEQVEKVGANIKSLKEPWLDTTTPQGRLLFTIFSGVSQFERELIRERTMEGLASARARGRMGGRPGKDKKTIEQALTLYDSKAYSVDEISKATGISRATLYKYVNLRKDVGQTTSYL